MSIIIKSKDQIEGIRKSCQLAARTLKHVSGFITPGITTQALDDIAVKYIKDNGAIAAPLNYNGFPKSICISINNVVCHGIPSKKETLKTGDIVNIDITTVLNGYYGDTSASYPVGKISPEDQKLLDVTRESMMLAVRSLKPGRFINDCVGKVIEPYVKKYGFSVVKDLGGHGVGLKFHEDPFVYHYDTGSPGEKLRPGMVFTIEPMINAGSNSDITLDPNDGWTIRTKDGLKSAQFEHTILITSTGYEILTKI